LFCWEGGIIIIESCILHLASCILHLASCILHLASCILHLASCILHLASCILHLFVWSFEKPKFCAPKMMFKTPLVYWFSVNHLTLHYRHKLRAAAYQYPIYDSIQDLSRYLGLSLSSNVPATSTAQKPMR